MDMNQRYCRLCKAKLNFLGQTKQMLTYRCRGCGSRWSRRTRKHLKNRRNLT